MIICRNMSAGQSSLATTTRLRHRGWRLSRVTSLACFEHLRAADALMAPSDAVRGAPFSRSPKARKFVATYARFFCNMALQSADFQMARPTKLCAAIVRATRVLLNVTPAWPLRLARFTGYDDVTELSDDVLSYYAREFPDHHRSVQTFASSPKSVSDVRLFPDDAAASSPLRDRTNFFDSG